MLYIWIYPQEAKTSGQHGKEFMNLLQTDVRAAEQIDRGLFQ